MSFHVPLHGRGRGAPDLFRKGFGPLMRWDLTELDSLDDLHLPRGAIKRAQDLAAQLFGAGETFFLVNGVTVGLIALFLAFCRPGDKVLVSRISHKAVLHGAILSGARPVFIPVEKDSATGFPLNVSAKAVEKALQEHPDARLLLLTSPSYWGVTADLPAIRKIADRYSSVIFAVDEAHGAHFPFYWDKLPHSAAAGADLWLHSAHKSLGALTPGAFLHIGNERLVSPLKFWLQVLQTSSPSYPVMISLDLIRRQVAFKGETLFSRTWKWAAYLRYKLERKGIEIFSPESKGEFALDPCRITLLCRRGGGSLLAKRLRQSCRIELEIHASEYLLAIVGPAQLPFSVDAVAGAFSSAWRGMPVSYKRSTRLKKAMPLVFPPSFFNNSAGFSRENDRGSTFSVFNLAPREALHSPSFFVALENSSGKICAEMVVLSPPGIPLLSPGELIRGDLLQFLIKKRREGALFQGTADPSLKTIRVISQ